MLLILTDLDITPDVVCTAGCRPGYGLHPFRQECAPCAAGFYSPGGALSPCISCPLPFMTTPSRATSIEDCRCMPGGCWARRFWAEVGCNGLTAPLCRHERVRHVCCALHVCQASATTWKWQPGINCKSKEHALHFMPAAVHDHAKSRHKHRGLQVHARWVLGSARAGETCVPPMTPPLAADWGYRSGLSGASRTQSTWQVHAGCMPGGWWLGTSHFFVLK
jgi:hypothetical protein